MKRNKGIVFLLMAIILSNCEEVLEKPLTDEKVVLQAPANQLVTTDTAHNFYWQEVEGATKYQLQVVSPRFDSIAKLVADTPTAALFLRLALNKGQYQWRVRAKNNSTASDYSDTWNLTIQ